MRSFARIIKDVLLFPVITVVKTIKFNLGISGFKFESGYDGGYFPDGMAHATLGNFVAISILGQYMGWDRDSYVAALLVCFLYMFLAGIFLFGLLWAYLDIHFPTGNWFYLPKDGPPPIDQNKHQQPKGD